MTSYMKEALTNLTNEYKLRVEFAEENYIQDLFKEYVEDFMDLTEEKKEWWDYRMDEPGHSRRLNKFMERIAPFY